MTTTRCGIEETTTTPNVALENRHNAKFGIRETATKRNFALWKLQ